ncbi:MAG: aconitase X swivel domain-containing protein [Actinomycetota bacterium]
MSEARTLVAGHATGVALVLDEPLSFWGGLDTATGHLIDTHHPQLGESVIGRVLVMTSGRGSSSSSYVLAEAMRAGTAPAAIVLREPDGIVALGSIVARELYGFSMPIVALAQPSYDELRPNAVLEIRASADGASVTALSDRPEGG